MNRLLSNDECITLLRKVGCSEAVICHCQAVRDVAIRIAEKTTANEALVETGALLHDIGRAKTHGIRHAIEGAKTAESLGLPKEVIHIIERHIGAGLSAEVAASLGLPKKDFIPVTLEEKIVCHADNLIEDCTRQPIEAEVERALLDGKKEYALQLIRLHHELSTICGLDLNMI